MPVRTGIDALPSFRAETPGARIVMFSLDSAARERALAAGAHMFVSKDAPMHEILASMKPRHAGPAPQPSNITLPRIPDMRHLRHAAIVMAIALVAYVGAFLLVEPVLGASAGVFSAVPVVIDLLEDATPNVRWKAEEVLYRLAEGQPPAVPRLQR